MRLEVKAADEKTAIQALDASKACGAIDQARQALANLALILDDHDVDRVGWRPAGRAATVFGSCKRSRHDRHCMEEGLAMHYLLM